MPSRGRKPKPDQSSHIKLSTQEPTCKLDTWGTQPRVSSHFILSVILCVYSHHDSALRKAKSAPGRPADQNAGFRNTYPNGSPVTGINKQ